MKAKGMVYVVGAGPGGVGLLTLRGAELLRQAGLVVHDCSISPDILKLAPAGAEVIPAAPSPPNPAAGAAALAERARQCGMAVRLVAGDLARDSHAFAEVQALQQSGIPFEVVPGVAAAGAPPKDAKERPLFGQRVVVTRARDQAGALSEPLSQRGARVIEVPVIKVAPPTDRGPLMDALLGLHEYDWLVFTSVNGVNAFFDYFFKAFADLRDLGGARLAAVGPATANRLKELHLGVDAMPEEALGRKVEQAMSREGSLENLRICLLRAEVANPEILKALEEKRAIVDDIACYKTVPETEDLNGAAGKMLKEGADWLTFTSGSTVEHFHARFDLPALLKKFPRMRTASIGPETSKALAALGLQPAVEAREHTMDGLVKALEKAAR